MQLTFATLYKEGNVTSSSTATFSKLGNQSMYAAYETSYQCAGAFNYTADAVDAEAGAKKYAPILSIVDVGMQSFIPLGKKTPSPAFGDAVCPHIVNSTYCFVPWGVFFLFCLFLTNTRVLFFCFCFVLRWQSATRSG